MSHPQSRRLGSALLLACALLALATTAPATAGAKKKTVQLSGTVYTFNDPNPIAGASVRIAELPGLAATTGADGTYDLEVPDGTRITPYVEAAGHHGIHLQTFVTAGKDIERANFQIPSDAVYSGLAALLGVPLDENGDPEQCVVVSTFSTAAIRDLSFAEFVAYGAHGVAGATASSKPTLPGPIYFNSSVIPDPSLTESSDDGGVIWLDVPKGVYRFHAEHPSERFADFVATCKPGRLVNANPPQGLYELRPGEKADSRVRARLTSAGPVGGPGAPKVELETRAREYAAVEAELTHRGRRLGEAGGVDGAGAYERGRRALSIVAHGAGDARRARLRVRFSDAVGNVKKVTTGVRLEEASR